MQGERHFAAEDVLVEPVEAGADDRAEFVHRRAEVTAGEQFFIEPAGFEAVDVVGQLVAAFGFGKQALGHGICREHAGLHRRVAAFDLGHVHGAQVTANQCTALEDHLRQRVDAAFGQGAGAVADALAAFQVLSQNRVVLEALEFIERRQESVAVGQVDDQADHHLVVFQVIKERATGVLVAHDVQRPTGGVDDQAWLVLGRVDFPDFLEADAVVLGVSVAVQFEALDQLLADVAAAAFGEQRVLAAQFHAGGVDAFFRIAFAVDAEVTGDDPADHAVFVEERFLGGEAWVDFHTQVFGLLGQPAAQVAEGDDVVAFVVHGLGHKEVRHLGGGVGTAQYIDVIAHYRGVERGAEFLPVREQLVQGTWFEHGTGKDMCADFGAFLDHADADFFTGFGGLLLQSAGGRQACRASADDDHVEFHVFAFHRLSPTQGSTGFFF